MDIRNSLFNLSIAIMKLHIVVSLLWHQNNFLSKYFTFPNSFLTVRQISSGDSVKTEIQHCNLQRKTG